MEPDTSPNRIPSDPTPAQIRARCQEIQANWSPAARRARERGLQLGQPAYRRCYHDGSPESVEVRIVKTADLPFPLL